MYLHDDVGIPADYRHMPGYGGMNHQAAVTALIFCDSQRLTQPVCVNLYSHDHSVWYAHGFLGWYSIWTYIPRISSTFTATHLHFSAVFAAIDMRSTPKDQARAVHTCCHVPIDRNIENIESCRNEFLFTLRYDDFG